MNCRRYSDLFSTIHDESAPVGRLGRGTHYSVLRATLWTPSATAHDFAVIWDEDHDQRVIWVAEQLCVRGHLGGILAIGERKGHLTVLTQSRRSPELISAVADVATNLPTDTFSSEVEEFAAASAMIINDDPARVRSYLGGVHAMWSLGTKPVTFNTAPFYPH